MNTTFKQILKICKPFQKHLLIVFGLVVITQLIGLIPGYLMGEIVDSVSTNIAAGNNGFQGTLNFVLLSVLSTTIVHFLFRIRQLYEIKHIDRGLPDYIDKISLRHLSTLSIGQVISRHSGVIQSVIGKGINSLNGFVQTIIYQVFPMIVTTILILVALLILYPAVGVVLLIATICLMWFTLKVGVKYARRMKKYHKLDDRVNKYRSEFLKTLPSISLSGEGERMTNDHVDRRKRVSFFFRGALSQYIIVRAIPEILFMFIRYGLVIMAIWFVYKGHYALGSLVIIFNWSNRTVSELGQVANYYTKLVEQYQQIKKYFELMEIEPVVKEPENPIDLEGVKGKIEFRNVSFSYPKSNSDDGDFEAKEDPVLHNVSFTVNPGERVAFVGPSGAGKTTLLTLLARGYDPDEGEILIDDVPLTKIKSKDLRHHLGYVPQRTDLFDRTLGFNICFGANGNATAGPEVIVDVLERVGLDKYKNSLRRKVGERGLKLSGGEQKRVGIARILLKEPSICMVDEPTSDLDSITEQKVAGEIEKATDGMTTMTIAHRLSTVQHSDCIFVISDGKIVGKGTHEDLLESTPLYRDMVEHQKL